MSLIFWGGGPGVDPPGPDAGHSPLSATGQQKTTVIRLQTLDGVWETVGSDRLRGVWPENGTYKSDEWGPSTCSFDLRRDPGMIFPDLSAWTPIEVEFGGVLCWSGRVKETPIGEAERTINVQGKGWQYHLDDDQYQRTYAHTKLGDYRDIRTFPAADLSVYRAGPQVNADRGVALLSFPANATVANLTGCAILLDLGASVGRTLMVTYDTQTIRGNIYVELLAGDSPGLLGVQAQDNFGVTATGRTLGPVTAGGTFRYCGVRLHSQAGGPFTDATDTFARITSIKVWADASYQSVGVSTLKATQIIPDALNRATILLSPDRSGIDPDATVTFAFPEFALQGQKTPREVIQAANAVHDYRTQIDVRRRMIFGPKPSVPRIEIGAWPGSVFDDASANDGEEIYNRVVVEGNGADGAPLIVERSAGQQPGVPLAVISSPAPSNASFTTDAANWIASAGTTITRTTATVHSSPASGEWAGGGLEAGDTLTTTFTGTFRAGTTYALTLQLMASLDTARLLAQLGTSTDHASEWILVTDAGFAESTIGWTPTTDSASVTLTLRVAAVDSGPKIWVDSLRLAAAQPTLVDRRGFKRTHTLPVKNSLTPELGQQIGDVWLAAHKTTPLKGTVKITGNRATRDIKTGASFPPEQLLLMTGELLRLSHRVDPDTGGHGRDGRIAEVTYTPATDTAVVALDSRRTSHEALLERLAVVVGTGS